MMFWQARPSAPYLISSVHPFMTPAVLFSVTMVSAGKLRHAPQPLDEARTLIVSQVEHAVRDPTDQVITTIRLEIAQSSHAAHYIIFRNYSTTHHWCQTLTHFNRLASSPGESKQRRARQEGEVA